MSAEGSQLINPGHVVTMRTGLVFRGYCVLSYENADGRNCLLCSWEFGFPDVKGCARGFLLLREGSGFGVWVPLSGRCCRGS